MASVQRVCNGGICTMKTIQRVVWELSTPAGLVVVVIQDVKQVSVVRVAPAAVVVEAAVGKAAERAAERAEERGSDVPYL